MFNNLSKIWKFAIAIAAQVLVIFVIVIYKTAILSSGNFVLLELQPVDPRDMLRGDYVKVSYRISNVDTYDNYRSYPVMPQNCPNCGTSQSLSSNNNVNDIHNGDTVYVPLYKAGKFWQVSGNVTKSKPNLSASYSDCAGICVSDDQQIYLKGKVVAGAESRDLGYPSQTYPSNYTKHLTIAYGIEDYFVPEGKGRNLNFINNGQNYAKVAVGDDGSAVLKQLYLDDKPWP